MPDLDHLPIAITMGDACGIGPEIVAKLFADDASLPPTLVIGDEGILQRAIQSLALPNTVRVIDSPADRVLVIRGAAHAPILRELLERVPGVRVVAPGDVLR